MTQQSHFWAYTPRKPDLTEKAFHKIQHPFNVKSLQKVDIEGNYLKIKIIYDKPTANVILNSEITKTSLQRSKTRQRCPLSSLLFSIVLEVREVLAIREGKEIK